MKFKTIFVPASLALLATVAWTGFGIGPDGALNPASPASAGQDNKPALHGFYEVRRHIQSEGDCGEDAATADDDVAFFHLEG